MKELLYINFIDVIEEIPVEDIKSYCNWYAHTGVEDWADFTTEGKLRYIIGEYLCGDVDAKEESS